MKVNVDSSHNSGTGSSACGGLARDHNGRLVRGFYCSWVGSCNAVWAELWGLRRGIRLAQDLALRSVLFEMDSKVVVDMVLCGSTHISFLQPLLQEVVYLLRHPSWEASIVHTYREGNMCADFLASKGHNTDYEGVFFDICIPGLISLISADARGVCYPRAMV